MGGRFITPGLFPFTWKIAPLQEADGYTHRRVHLLAAELCEHKAVGRKLEAVAGRGELRGLRDAMLEQLQAQLHEGQ